MEFYIYSFVLKLKGIGISFPLCVGGSSSAVQSSEKFSADL
jgi:hypothetical protein